MLWNARLGMNIYMETSRSLGRWMWNMWNASNQVNRWKFAILKWPPKRSEQIEGLFMINWVNLVDQNSFLHRSFNIWYTAQKIA